MIVSNEWLFSLIVWLIGGSYAYTSVVLWYAIKIRNNHLQHLESEVDELRKRVQRLEN